MKVLVTGGAGFIGSHVVDKLIADKFEVVIIDDLSTGLRANINPLAKFIKMDIRSNQIFDVFSSEKINLVIHLAAQTMVPTSIKNPDLDCDINILGSINLLEACRKHHVKRIIFASSAAVYGNDHCPPITEDSATNPTSFYGLSKLSVEKYLDLYSRIFGLEYVVLRYANVYGERQGDSGEGGVISIFTKKIRKHELVQVFGDGNQTRDFIYVGDVASANLQALFTKYTNRTYNVSTSTETTINQLLQLLTRISSKDVNKQYLNSREGDIFRSSLSNKTACQLLDWQPQTQLIDGLTLTYNSLK